MLRKQRPYANHWEWPYKGIKEQGIMKDYLEARSQLGLRAFQSVESQKPDPPDFKAIDHLGRTIGIEITELVSEEAIRFNLKANSRDEYVYRDWTPKDVIKELHLKLDEKDTKKFHGGPYDDVQVVIFTDERLIRYIDIEEIIRSHRFKRLKQISHAYILFSYHAETKKYPLLELKMD